MGSNSHEFLRHAALVEALRRCELRRSAPRPHVRKITDDQIDLAVGHLVRRKSGHLQAGPIATDFGSRISARSPSLVRY